MDLSKLSDEDLIALKSGDLTKLSDEALIQLKGPATYSSESTNKSTGEKALDFAKNFGRGMLQTANDVSGGLISDAGSIGATALAIPDWAARQVGIQNDFIGRTDRRKAMDQAIQSLGANPNSVGYGVGKLTSGILGTAGVGNVLAKGLSAIPVAAKYAPSVIDALRTSGAAAGEATGAKALLAKVAGGAAASGTGAAMLDPAQAKIGTVMGGVLPVGFSALGQLPKITSWVSSKLGNSRDAAVKELADLAINKYNIPLGYGDITQSGTVKAAKSILKDAPITGGMAAKNIAKKQDAFNRAVGETFGVQGDRLTSDVVKPAVGKISSEFDRLWGQNNLKVDDELFNKMAELHTAAEKLPKSEGQALQAEINDLLSKMQKSDAGELVIPGETANKFQSYLRRRSESSPGLKYELSDLRKSMIGAFNRGVAPDDVNALSNAQSQWKAWKTLEPLLNQTETGVAGRLPGDVPAALLPGAVARSYSNAANTPLADISKIGSKFLVDRTPQTGGSQRALLQNTLLTGAGIGAGYAAPVATGAALLGSVGTQALLDNPRLAKYLISSGESGIGADLLDDMYKAVPALAQEYK
jgi:hypothetical protein